MNKLPSLRSFKSQRFSSSESGGKASSLLSWEFGSLLSKFRLRELSAQSEGLSIEHTFLIVVGDWESEIERLADSVWGHSLSSCKATSLSDYGFSHMALFTAAT